MNRSGPPLVLSLDKTGLPICWLTWQDAVSLYSRDRIAWTAGTPCFEARGGVNRLTGLRSSVTINSIIATHGVRPRSLDNAVPALSNASLFARDQYLCLYCGERFARSNLTRDHIVPRSRGGRDGWTNVVTACRPCNNRKGQRTPTEAGMMLLAVPYVPTWTERLVLANRHILADQMEFLRAHLPRGPRIRAC